MDCKLIVTFSFSSSSVNCLWSDCDLFFFFDSYDDIRAIFGMHLDWIFFIILLSAICWAYIKYIRPMVMNSIDGRQVLSRLLY